MDYILPVETHNRIVAAAFAKRGYNADECQHMAKFCQLASWHGIKTHNALKALHLDDHFGSGNTTNPGCVPDAKIEKKTGRFPAAQTWNANRKLGPAVAFEAMDAAIELADKYGVGIVSVDQAFHYLWGGGYVIDAAKKGYIAYTCCSAALAEVVPFCGKYPTLGTNPHSWGLPTTDAIGFPIVIDWATSAVAMGRVQQLAREGKQLPPGAGVDENGNATTDPNKVKALLTFGAHKGYGLSLIIEIYSALMGAGIPTARSRPEIAGDEKTTPNFFFQVIHPEAMDCGLMGMGRGQAENVKATIDDILGHGNREAGCILPGEMEHNAAVSSEKAGGLLFTQAEIDEFAQVAAAADVQFDPASLKQQ